MIFVTRRKISFHIGKSEHRSRTGRRPQGLKAHNLLCDLTRPCKGRSSTVAPAATLAPKKNGNRARDGTETNRRQPVTNPCSTVEERRLSAASSARKGTGLQPMRVPHPSRTFAKGGIPRPHPSRGLEAARPRRARLQSCRKPPRNGTESVRTARAASARMAK